MSLNGIWSAEMGGAYGWESVGTVFLQDGKLQGGGRNHYSVGSYEVKDDGSAVLSIDMVQFGERRALFGQKSEEVPIVVKAHRDGQVMMGEATMPGNLEYAIPVRFQLRGELP